MLPRRPPPRTRRDPGIQGLENALRGLALPGPDPDFERRLRARLLAASSVHPASATTRRPRHRSRPWLPRAVAAGAAGVVGVAGIGVATSRALPGQPFYGAKRHIESWQLSAASGPAERGREQLTFARTRLAEVEALSQHQDLTAADGTTAGGSTADRIASTLRRMDAETQAGASDLATAGRAGDRRAAQELRTFAVDQDAGLTGVAPRLPAAAAPAVDNSRSVLRKVAALARTLPGATAPAAAGRQGPAPTPAASSSRHAIRPTGTPSSVAVAPSPDVTGTAAVTRTPAFPWTMPTVPPGTSAPSEPAARPSGPQPWDLPTEISGLLSGPQSTPR